MSDEHSIPFHFIKGQICLRPCGFILVRPYFCCWQEEIIKRKTFRYDKWPLRFRDHVHTESLTLSCVVPNHECAVPNHICALPNYECVMPNCECLVRNCEWVVLIAIVWCLITDMWGIIGKVQCLIPTVRWIIVCLMWGLITKVRCLCAKVWCWILNQALLYVSYTTGSLSGHDSRHSKHNVPYRWHNTSHEM